MVFFFQHQLFTAHTLSLSKHLLKTSTSAEMEPEDRKRRQDRNSSRTGGCVRGPTSKAQTSRTTSVRGRGRPKGSRSGVSKTRPASKKPPRGRPRGSRVNKPRNKTTSTRRPASKKPARGRPKGSRVTKTTKTRRDSTKTPAKKTTDTAVSASYSNDSVESEKKTDGASNRQSQAKKKAEEDNSSDSESPTQSGTESARTDDSAPPQ